MPVDVVRVGHMRMGMMHRLVAMAVAVFARRHRFVHVVVMAIVVAVGVFVLQHFVLVHMAV